MESRASVEWCGRWTAHTHKTTSPTLCAAARRSLSTVGCINQLDSDVEWRVIGDTLIRMFACMHSSYSSPSATRPLDRLPAPHHLHRWLCCIASHITTTPDSNTPCQALSNDGTLVADTPFTLTHQSVHNSTPDLVSGPHVACKRRTCIYRRAGQSFSLSSHSTHSPLQLLSLFTQPYRSFAIPAICAQWAHVVHQRNIPLSHHLPSSTQTVSAVSTLDSRAAGRSWTRRIEWRHRRVHH